MPTTPPRKAIALMSGGLDSTLAAKLIKDQGIEVVGLHLLSPFGCREDVERSAAAVGIPLLVREKGAAYLDLVENPRYGYGRNMNPCIDCRIFMFQLADVVRHEEKADFIVTGEVVGQRPMSQQRHSMNLIDSNSPIEGLVVRPLSAQALPPTVPEQNGWVDREQLLRITGRGRKAQLELAQKWGIEDFSTPGGGCLLTDAQFSVRLKDFFQNPSHRTEEERLAQSELVRLGRHFRLSPQTKVIVARNEGENHHFMRLWDKANALVFHPDDFQGPSALAFGEIDASARETIGGIIARYGKPSLPAQIRFEGKQESGRFSVARVPSDEELSPFRIG